MVKRGGIFVLVLVILAPATFSVTLQDLIEIFDFDFLTGGVNVTNHNDLMIDKDKDNINDTLVIELETNANAGTYFIIVSLNDESTIKNETKKTLDSGISKFNISFSSDFLRKNRFNYTIKIYEENYSLKYCKEDIETKFYKNYKTAIKILGISDKSIDNNFLQINITLNSTKNREYDVIIYLKYNNSIFSSKTSNDIDTGTNSILINFSNEIIKNTHYAGKFNLAAVKFNDRIIKTDYLTDYYDYRDFAQSSYFDGFSDYGIDTNNNELYDYLVLNITIETKNSNDYKIELGIFDLFGNYIKNVEKIKNLNIGKNNVLMDINGTKINNKKLNGPYVIKYIKLIENGTVIDQINNAYITQNYDHADFENPNLPDLKLVIDAAEDYNVNNNINFNVTLENIGTKPAFNIFLEIFDNSTYSRNESLSSLLPGSSIKYTIGLVNTSDTELNAVVDFENFVEESNESNNMVKKIIKANEEPVIEDVCNYKINISLYPGWNIIGYPSREEGNPHIVFENVSEDIVNVFSFESGSWYGYSPAKSDSFNNLEILYPSLGYWIKIKNYTNWTYDNGKFRK